MTGDDEEGEVTHQGGLRPIRRAAYVAATLPLLLLQYGIVFILRFEAYEPGRIPLLGRLTFSEVAIPIGVIILACTVAIGWLSARRASTIGASDGQVTAAIVPWVQLVAIPILAFRLPSETAPAREPYLMIRGALWGLAIALAAEIVFTLVLGEFGIALFVGSPFLVGLVPAYLASRDGYDHPILLGQQALLLASTVMFGFAYEGLICLLFAYPLAMTAALIGGMFGIWLGGNAANRTTVASSIVLLPLLTVAELSSPPLATFADSQSVEVAAPPEAVWNSIVHMGTIDQAPGGPFGWGMAYPVAGQIDGSGIGAVRRGVFSTGIAYERVTRWEPNRELWFDVLTDPPMMVETNPFGPVRSAHLDDYFVTRTAHFTIEPTTPGRSRLTLTTDHALRIGPTTYFLPIARWAVNENKSRVLGHFRDRAETAAGRTAQ